MQAEITPDGDALHNAIVGSPYFSEINITGGAVYALDSNGREKLVGEITPSNTGLTLQYCDNSPARNCIKIQGIPKKAGIVKVRVSGRLFGTNIATGGRFDKTYTISIIKPENI